jgi:hypothetical protein
VASGVSVYDHSTFLLGLCARLARQDSWHLRHQDSVVAPLRAELPKNTIDGALRAAMAALIHHHPLRIHPWPNSLEEWSKHLRMSVLGYSAYFGAFYTSFEQYVGGGADVVAVPWP